MRKERQIGSISVESSHDRTIDLYQDDIEADSETMAHGPYCRTQLIEIPLDQVDAINDRIRTERDRLVKELAKE